MDEITAVGRVHVVQRDNKTGEIILDTWFKNQITNYARGQMALSWGQSVNGTSIIFPSLIAVGTGSPPSGQTGTTPTDTTLWSEFSGSRKTVDYAQQWLQYYIQYSVTYQNTEVLGTVDPQTNPNGSIAVTECGLFDSAGNLWSHVQLSGITHDNTSTLSIQWQILMQGN